MVGIDTVRTVAVGAILQSASYNLPTMFCGRIITGVGNGINTATAPIWQTETSQAHWRGKLVLLEMWMNIAGFSLVSRMHPLGMTLNHQS